MNKYEIPDDLITVQSAARCETDVIIKILEPEVKGTITNNPSGINWTGVQGIDIKITGGGKSLIEKADSNGIANFSSVPCGSYIVTLEQAEFKVKLLSSSAITVNSGSKRGNMFDFKVKRQLLTLEAFRLPTLYIESVKAGLGKQTNTNQDPYGHHWVKIYNDESAATSERPSESYGWWPIESASADKLWDGVKGSLNGYPVHSSSLKRDPYHTEYLRGSSKLEDVFFPYVTNGKTAQQYKNEIRSKSNAYAGISGNIWSWRGNGAGYHCKTFQTYLMREVHFWKRLGVGFGNWGWSANT